MTTSMYCLYVGFDYAYIYINALAQGIKSFLASQVWFQVVAGARTFGTDSPAMYVCMYVLKSHVRSCLQVLHCIMLYVYIRTAYQSII